MSANSQPLRAADSDGSSLEGRTVGSGRFEVRSELGRGGMGEVYLAYDRRRRREVALKLIATRYMGRPERERRFRNEAEYARGVRTHPNVVSVIDAGELADCEGRLFMTMESVRGPTLAMELAMLRRVPMDQVAEWARQLARGLAAIHAAGIVHRDLTTSNILIQSGTKVAKIFDFGLAGELDSPTSTHGSRLTVLDEVPGTEGYMAPEQAMLAVPAATMDVFAFGVVLTEMLVGCNPFVHLDRDEYIEWQQTSHREVKSIKRWNLPFPDGLVELVDDCLRRDPKARPQSAAELLDRLDRIFPPAVAELVPLPTATKPSEDGLAPPPTATKPSEDELEPVPTATKPNEYELEPRTLAEVAAEPRPALRRLLPMAALLALSMLVIGGVIGWRLANAVEEPDGSASPAVEGHEGVEEPAPQKTTSQVPPSDEELTAPVEPPEEIPGPSGPASEVKPPKPTSEPASPDRDATVTEPVAPSDESQPPKVKPSDSASATSCETQRQRAHDGYRRKAWKKVLSATRDGRCWPDEAERTRLRVRALAETGQNNACVRLAMSSRDPETSKWKTTCEQDVWKP
ncbi:serine/threonine-protein kinase [Paraliomyxa miuraensis]|uniref:serine/threonine-protein kinase n=1 Tax=Paraliomyxa miuraensis TaxID=376150 RepID=UPI002258A1CE|nr:serine/threonine protein kinase [Paraliomyxa miuraensis]MCX4239116.1 protein kinase [Paraliomyxa miuraensis]